MSLLVSVSIGFDADVNFKSGNAFIRSSRSFHDNKLK